MKVKIDTKEKFHVLTIQEPYLPANMTEECKQLLLLNLEKDLKNIVLNMNEVDKIDELVAVALSEVHDTFHANNASFVICEIKPVVQQCFKDLTLQALMNTVPTESEAFDIVYLEEIERELMQ